MILRDPQWVFQNAQCPYSIRFPRSVPYHLFKGPRQVFLLGLTVFMVGWAVRGFIAAHQVADARQQIAAAEALTQLFKDQLEVLMQTVADAAPNRTIELKRLELELAKHQAECLRKQRLAHEQKR